MTTLDEAWAWYQAVRRLAKLTRRLAENHWDSLGWEGSPGKDEFLRNLNPENLAEEAASITDALADLAVLVLFSVFEATVREAVLAEVLPEVERLSHPALRHAAGEACERIENGSFFGVLKPFKTLQTNDLIEEVNQVRQYRNWVAHGRRGHSPVRVTPEMAFDRLTRFLAGLMPRSSE